ncbi:cytosolic sulfotransferase 5-like [Triticum dicoccoides]|uniref:cytosolic sulfotransferase 5-like n=1 Tax=Triticum dicoccoides TaxID=85692 RepID=UPI00162BB52E|nr:cytosolic sulfotransferase 5-like [Triticum dicoccoides]
MVGSETSSLLHGPVAFKDADDGTIPVHPPTEYAAAVASLPTNQNHASNSKLKRRCYQGVWVREEWAPGIMAMQRSFAARPGDVVLASVPKSGTTWLKALIFATMVRAACPPASPAHPLRRLNPHDCVPLVDRLFAVGREAVLDALPSPRLMCTHMPLSVLPPSISGGPYCKIVYICRDPKDMVVSLWHFINRAQPDISLQEMFETVCEGTSNGGPFWDHILGYWRASNAEPSRVLFLTYEQMLQDPLDKVRKLAQFLGRPFSDTEEEAGVVAEIVELCSLENLKNLEVNKKGSQGVFFKFSHDSYFRNGVVGDWVNHLTPEMAKRLDAICEEKFRGSGFTF